MASKAYIGDMYGTISLDARSYMAGLAAVQKITTGALGKVSGTLKRALGGFIAFEAIRGATSAINAQYKAMANLQKIASQFGDVPVNIQILGEAAEFAGDTNLDLSKSLQKVASLQTELGDGSKSVAKMLREMGVNAEVFARSPVSQAFAQIVSAISDIEDGSDRATASYRIFGRESEELTNLLQNGRGAFSEAARQMDAIGSSISQWDTAKAMVVLQSFADLADVWDNFKRRMAVALAPMAAGLADFVRKGLEGIDVRDLADKITGLVGGVVGFISSVPIRIEKMLAQVKLKFIELNNILPPMLRMGVDGSPEAVAGIRAEIEALSASIDTTQFSSATDFMKTVGDMYEKLQKGGAKPGERGLSPFADQLKRDLEAVKATIEDGLTESLAEFVTTGKSGLRELAQVVIKDLAAAFLRAQVVMPALQWLGIGTGAAGGPGMLGKIFGGFRAGGGGVEAGKAYMVGERRPELFVPRTSGTIVPSTRGLGGGSHYYIDARGADSAAISRLENMIMALNGSIESRSVAAVIDASRRRMPGFAG